LRTGRSGDLLTRSGKRVNEVEIITVYEVKSTTMH
jgi:hypothetical protein